MHYKTKEISLTLSVLVLLICVLGVTLAQTFQYSRGWTNGKKRGGASPVIFQETEDGNEVLGVCQMGRLREMLTQKRQDPIYLPCEVIGKPEEEIMDRFRRKTNEFENSSFDNVGAHGQ